MPFRISIAGVVVVLLAVTSATIAEPVVAEGGSICIAPVRDDATTLDAETANRRGYVSYEFSVKVDEGDWIRVPSDKPRPIKNVEGDDKHLVQIRDGDRLIESFWFTFEDRGGDSLCLSYKPWYQTWMLGPPANRSWCDCSGQQTGGASTEPGAPPLGVTIRDVHGQPVSLGRVHVSREVPPEPEFHENKDVDAGGYCEFALLPGTYGVRWDTKDSLRPVRVEVNGAVLEHYPTFVKTHDSGDDDDKVRVIGGRVVGAEIVIDTQPVTVSFVVPADLQKNRVSGLVLDELGDPIAKLRFEVYRGDAMNCARCAVTGDDGRFEFVSREFPIRLVPRDYTGLWLFDPVEQELAGPQDSAVNFLARRQTPLRLAGVVVDAAHSTGVPDVWVEYKQECLNAWAEGRVKSDEAGKFSASCHRECGMSIELWHQEHEYERLDVSLPPGSCDETLRVQMQQR